MLNSYTVYFEGYLTVNATSKNDAIDQVSNELEQVVEEYTITDVMNE